MRIKTSITIACLVFVAALPARAMADTIYASPGGSTTAASCPASARCSIEHAVEHVAQVDDVVEAAPGDYNVDHLVITRKLTLRGEPGSERPRIVSTDLPFAVSGAGAGAMVQHVTIDLVGNGTAVILNGSTTIEGSQILAHGPGNTASDSDALSSSAPATIRDTTIQANTTATLSARPSLVATKGLLTLRGVTVTRIDNNTAPAVGLGSDPSAAIDADGLTVSARNCVDVGGTAGTVVRDLNATQRPDSGRSPCVTLADSAHLEDATIQGTVEEPPGTTVAAHDDSTLSRVEIDAPAGIAARLDERARLDRADVTALHGVELFGGSALTNSLVVASGDFAARSAGTLPDTQHIANSTLIGPPATSGFLKDGTSPIEVVNTIVAAGVDVNVNNPGAVISHSRFVSHRGGAFTDAGGNTAAGPRFLDSTTGDYRLQPESSMIDAGVTHDLLGTLDLGGLARVSGAAPDIGAYEFQHPAPVDPPSGDQQQPQPSSPSGPGTIAPIDDLAPSLSGASVRPRSFIAGSRTTRLRFTLSEPATVSLTTYRELPGRRSGRRCVKPSRKLQRAKRCTRLLRSGRAAKVDGRAGANSVPFRGRGLKPGPHRVTLAPTDAAGNRGRAVSARFAVVPRRKKR